MQYGYAKKSYGLVVASKKLYMNLDGHISKFPQYIVKDQMNYFVYLHKSLWLWAHDGIKFYIYRDKEYGISKIWW